MRFFRRKFHTGKTEEISEGEVRAFMADWYKDPDRIYQELIRGHEFFSNEALYWAETDYIGDEKGRVIS